VRVVRRLSGTLQSNGTKPVSETCLPLHYLASCLARLLETARRELDSDCEAAKTSLDTASRILQSEMKRSSGANGSRRLPLTGWQRSRVRAFIEENLHRDIGTRDLGAVARQSPARFSRSFKEAFGEPPHAYVVRRRLEKACHLMVTSSESLSQIALRVGFADQAHQCKHFRRIFGRPPSIWRREHETQGPISRAGMRKEGAFIAHRDGPGRLPLRGQGHPEWSG
jgi:AraC family transcriptional regulator